MSSKSELESLLNKIVKSNDETEVSKALKEIEDNNEYIEKKQLRSLLTMHDKKFKDQCLIPMNNLYVKYNDIVGKDRNLQNETAFVDRDIRVLESTLQYIIENKNSHNTNHGGCNKTKNSSKDKLLDK
ncbi:hypothetical protein Kpol_1055p66 [Vanderwaltozyma polyspora DSM 70294]|uniref:Biogenesis of lysosome-related organelles complex 1 subunit BLS1 n=1 Tax=Vanderwaltozyma polyspora (strain ATCC 22028 / DSM 70294 / BCRC 21397 / CBS 2163 / NBRC 10782 / NRRL Y-8283 / UCD 57-17) TaxID=436907 RepID=BL1S1_VANPO|nr:uncharacterized protein Kpol_1055p66 [Vanderwaltozyma polyspora DSM 70294]A7TGD9.1 RecName: Full=Biogenesis of lysosome-related organelles complex 1 subunit BLS1; Short=BLOC-1 subunit BLS1; AltName: Full=BLOS1-homolog [Vanderwaltozyma polyspora DSM 70294]EDO18709.1 hypothetical protein Kpol_1055p66 [Vanderwaltozyma polyspora DSM 70294]